MTGYVELQCTTHFSFLRGASSCDELFERAKELGITALGITDRNSLAGIVRAKVASRATGVRLIVGCRLDLVDGMSLLVYPTSITGYKRLCRLLTIGKRRAGKGECHLNWTDVEHHSDDLLAVLIPGEPEISTVHQLRKIKGVFGNRAYMALTLRRRPNDQLRLHKLANMAVTAGVQSVVTNDVLFHDPEREIMQDVVTCIRHNCTVDELGQYREPFADRYLKPAAEMYRLFPRNPEAVARSEAIAQRCQFSLDELAYKYPDEKTMPGLTAQEALEHMTWEGAANRYPDGVPDEVKGTLRHELNLISRMEYAPYFLTVNSIVRYARSQNILCQGRGSAANSAVCFVLGITSIDPALNDLLFERFVSEERREPPDIDVDFESDEQRENVIQWVFSHYGRDHAALCSTVIRYRSKGAWRDVAKAMGLPEDLISNLSSQLSHWSQNGIEAYHLEGLNINLKDRRLRLAIELSQQLLGTPRHLSQHPGGFVLTQDRLDELVPIEPASMVDRQVIEWDKDDIDEMKFMKMDCLGLGMLKCMRLAFELMERHKGIKLDLATIPPEDPATFAMIRKADTLGTFQIESRAQMNSLPRTKPRTFYDLVIQVAIVRPGPIQGDMVHPYLRRREGLEEVTFPKPELERVLAKTLGVPLFQEQAMRIAIECAGFTPSEADQLRRSMATFKFTGGVSKYKDKLITGMTANGYDEEYAEKVFSQIEGFGSYGFPESHAASFALIAYASCWLKCHHPEIFCAALLNAQPMGFYAPAQIVTDVRRHGVAVLPVCVNNSRWDATLEPEGDTGRFAVRLGFSTVKGFANRDASKIVTARADMPFSSVDDLWHRSGVGNGALVTLANADAFAPTLKLARREALWAIKALRDEPLPLFAAAARQENTYIREVVEPAVALKAMTAGNEVVHDYQNLGLTLRAHPLTFLREDLAKAGIITCTEASNTPDEKYVRVAGMVLIRQMPGSAKGVMFITIEDETGHTNVVVWPKKYDIYRRVIHSASMMMISGQIQREGDVVHLIARSIADFSDQLASVGDRDGKFPLPHGRGDEFFHGSPRTDPRDDGIRVRTRDFR